MAFRDAAREALRLAAAGPDGALAAADVVLAASDRYRKGLKGVLEEELAPFLDDRGRVEEPFRGVVRRLEDRHKRRLRRAERDYVDWVLLAASSLLRDRVASGRGGPSAPLMNLDLPAEAGDVVAAARALGVIEEARAACADETNLNLRLVLEGAFLKVWRSHAGAA